jgi:ribonuclease VapC
MSEVVLDSSAVLAWIFGEPGRERVADALPRALLDAVNLAEVTSKLVDHGYVATEIGDALRDLDVTVVAFTEARATEAGLLREETRSAGLSLGDRACLALAIELGVPALAADKRWTNARTKAKVELIR